MWPNPYPINYFMQFKKIEQNRFLSFSNTFYVDVVKYVNMSVCADMHTYMWWCTYMCRYRVHCSIQLSNFIYLLIGGHWRSRECEAFSHEDRQRWLLSSADQVFPWRKRIHYEVQTADFSKRQLYRLSEDYIKLQLYRLGEDFQQWK